MRIESEKLLDEQIYFLKNQFWSLTIQASFSRAHVYLSNDKKESYVTEEQKAIFKRDMYHFVNDKLITKFQNTNDTEQTALASIIELQKWSKDNYSSILKSSELSIGVCQKLINLYLKYLWCSRLINFTPPLFPLDRLIQEKTMKKVLTNWTTFNDGIIEYREIMNQIYKNKNKAEWELIEYNNILRNG